MSYHVSFDLEFKKNSYPGKLIVIEGLDGSGKTTQVEKIANKLKAKKIAVISTKEPTNGVIGKLIRQVLGGAVNIPLVSFQYLFVADRTAHQEEILKYLKEGKWVISDRYFWSSVAYGMADKDDVDYENKNQVMLVAQSILSMYHQFVIPDYTFCLDVSLDTAMKRIAEKEHKEIYERLEKLQKIQKGYDWLLTQFPREITTVDGEKSIEEVTSRVVAIIK